jgi:cytochrome c-type biogenesis protein CcmH/NrfF
VQHVNGVFYQAVIARYGHFVSLMEPNISQMTIIHIVDLFKSSFKVTILGN